MKNSNPLVSIVIPCFNEEKYVEGCITSFLTCNYSNIEILIIDGGSSDHTLQIVENLSSIHSNVFLINNIKQKTPFALNLGVQKSKGEFILIASAHSSFDKNYISDLLPFLDNDVAAVGGVMKTKVKNSTKVSESIKEVLSNKFGVGNALFRTGVTNVMEVDTVPFGLYRKELLIEIDGYDERLIRNHDIEMSKRILARGYKILLVPSVECTYYARESYNRLAKNNFRNGRWNILTVFITKNFSSLSIRHFIPFLFTSSIVFSVLGLFFSTSLFYLLFLILGIYLIAMLFVSVNVKNNKTDVFHLIFAFFSLHFSYGFGSIVGILSIAFKKVN